MHRPIPTWSSPRIGILPASDQYAFDGTGRTVALPCVAFDESIDNIGTSIMSVDMSLNERRTDPHVVIKDDDHGSDGQRDPADGERRRPTVWIAQPA